MRLLLESVQDLSNVDDPSLAGVLQRTVESACRITGAHYGAMGVLADGKPTALTHFITTGMTDAQRQAIGDPPEGRGILGRLMRDSVGARLADVTLEADAVGFPAGHPIMRTFLGMPIRTGSTVFGNVYLTEKSGGQEFTDQDQLMLSALASWAGVVIDLMRRRLEGDSQRATVSTLRQINRSLLTEDDPARVVPLVIAQAIASTGAESALVAMVTGGTDPRVKIVAAQGSGCDSLLEALHPQVIESVASGQSSHWATPEPGVLLDHQAGPPHTSIVPVTLPKRAAVVLLVDRWRPAATASPRLTEDLIESLGDQVGLVLDRVDADKSHDAMTKVADRERIAQDLHDLVIQRIFAAGLTLQGAARLGSEPAVLDRIEQTISELDATIRDIRATIFALKPIGSDTSVQDRIRALIGSYAQNLGFTPTLNCSGVIEDNVDEEGALALLLVLREALSNVARHAHATSVEIDLRVQADHMVVVVTDDGVGLPAQVVESGLGNVRARARQRGGSMDLMAHTPRGTVLRWQVPLR